MAVYGRRNSAIFKNSFAFTKLTIHNQQIVFIFKNVNILIQQNSYSYSTKIQFMHIQQKSYSYSTKILFIFNKNLIHIQQKYYSYSTKILFIFNKNLIHIQQKSFAFNKNRIHIQQKKSHSYSNIHIQQIPETVARLSHSKILQNGNFPSRRNTCMCTRRITKN